MKLLICTILLLSALNLTLSKQTPLTGNPYIADENVVHSLYKDQNVWNRISGDDTGVPLKKKLDEEKQFQNPSSYVAFKIAKFYRQVFEFLDEDVDDFLLEEDLVRAYRLYSLPMPTDVPIEEYVKDKFKQVDQNARNKIDFVEFCRFMEGVWKFAEFDIQRNCVSALRRSINVFDKLFEFLDDDRDGLIDRMNVEYGISFVTNKNIDSDDVGRAFKEYDKDQNGKFNKAEFILAVMNGQMVRSIQDTAITESFFS